MEELLDFDEEASDISEILRKLSAAAGLRSSAKNSSLESFASRPSFSRNDPIRLRFSRILGMFNLEMTIFDHLGKVGFEHPPLDGKIGGEFDDEVFIVIGELLIFRVDAATGNNFKLETKRSKARCPGRRFVGYRKEPHPGAVARHPG